MLPFSTLLPDRAKKVRFVLMDIDDTMTTAGKMTAESFEALWRLENEGIVVVPITGRPAGWCDLIVREWPVDGVVGENGAFAFYIEGGRRMDFYHPEAVKPNTDTVFEAMRCSVLAGVPGCRVAKDQFCRLFDIAFDFAEEPPVLPLEAAARIKDICEGFGARAKISSIHVNSWFGRFDKLSMTELFLAHRFGYRPETESDAILFFGDSPNDEPMFRHFNLSCGVANVHRYADLMASLPSFVTTRENGAGFAEGVEIFLDIRKS
jgi:HAD superfamily hydrolase (TIGR01484 family)